MPVTYLSYCTYRYKTHTLASPDVLGNMFAQFKIRLTVHNEMFVPIHFFTIARFLS